MDIIVHQLEKSRSQRVLWLLEKLHLPYRVVRYYRDPETGSAPRSVADVHPLGKLPISQIGSRILTESGPIFDYLRKQSPANIGSPSDSVERLRYQHFVPLCRGISYAPSVRYWFYLAWATLRNWLYQI